MTSFAEKVRGLTSAQIPRSSQQDSGTESASTDEVEADVVEAINFQNNDATIHPTQATNGEKFPEGYFRSYGGFLLRHDTRIIPVDQRMVRRVMEYLSRHVLLAFFVGGRPSQHSLLHWVEFVQRQVGGYVAIG